MARTRTIAIAGVGVLAAVTVAIFSFGRFGSDTPLTRTQLAGSGKVACFKNARADVRNTLVTDASLTAYCSCLMEHSVAVMTDDDLRQTATNATKISDPMRKKVAEANTICLPELSK